MRTFATESGKRMIRRLAIVLCLSLIIGLIPNALLSAPVTANAAELSMVTNPQAGVAYKAGLVQKNLGKTLYFNGEMDGNFLATTDKVDDAVDLVLEAGNGGFYLSFTKNGQKSYINFEKYTKSNGYFGCAVSISTDRPATVAKFNTEWKGFEIDFGDASFVLGTYSSWATISASDVYYISGDKAADIDVSQFLLHLYSTGSGNQGGNGGATTPTTAPTTPTAPAVELEMVTAPVANTAYKIGLVQNNLGKTLYFIGEMDSSGKYLALSEDASKAVDVKLEAANGGGYYLYFMKGSTKTYINYEEYTKSSGYPGCRLSLSTSAPAVAMTYNSAWNTMVVSFGVNSFILGTYQSYNTISASSTSYIEGDKISEIGVSQFLMRFYAKPAASQPTQPTESQPAATQPAATQPAATQPAATQPAATQPAATQPAATQPAATQPVATQPQTEIVVVDDPDTGVAYMAGLAQKTLGKTLYFTGNTVSGKDYWLETTEDASKAVELKLEATEGGYYLYFMKGNDKTYIEIYEYTKEGEKYPKGSLKLTTDKPASVLTFNSEWNTLVATFGENSYYMGTYNNYNTISVSSTYYISGDKAADVDNTQFPLRLYIETEVGNGGSGDGDIDSGDGNANSADNTMVITASTVMILALAAAVVVLFRKRKFF